MTLLLIGIGISYTASTAVLHRVDKSALNLVNNYINDEKYAQAEEVLNKVEFKNNENYYFLLSYIQLKNKEFAKAEENLQKTIALNPQFHEAYYNLAVVSLYNEDLTKAREYIQTAIELDENNLKYLRLWDKIKE